MLDCSEVECCSEVDEVKLWRSESPRKPSARLSLSWLPPVETLSPRLEERRKCNGVYQQQVITNPEPVPTSTRRLLNPSSRPHASSVATASLPSGSRRASSASASSSLASNLGSIATACSRAGTLAAVSSKRATFCSDSSRR